MFNVPMPKWIDHVRSMRWMNIAPIVTMAAFAAFASPMLLGALGIFLTVHVDGIRGTVTAPSCEPFIGRGGHQTGWTCSGRFRSDDGMVSIPKVEITSPLREQPHAPVPALVSDPSATMAILPDLPWKLALGTGLVILGVGVYMTSRWYAWWERRQVRAAKRLSPS